MDRRYAIVFSIVAAAFAAGRAGSSAAQTRPDPPTPAPAAQETPRVSGTFELLESVALDGRPDPAFGDLDGRTSVRALVRSTCSGADSSGRTRAVHVRTLSWSQLDALGDDPCVERVEPARLPGGLRALETTTVVAGIDSAHRRPMANVTGAGQTIAVLDSPVDILHPAFFRPDGGRYSWIDVDGDGRFSVGTDAVDLDRDGEFDSDERLGLVDGDGSTADASRVFEPRRDWLYADENGDGRRNAGASAGFTEFDPGYAEPTFVADDVDRDGRLEPREPLYRLDTCKIRRLVVGDETYVRGTDLVEAARDLPRRSAHGTAVAGVLVGGPLGFHDRVGVAPRAELLVYGTEQPGPADRRIARDLHVDAMRDAADRGATVFLTEWLNPFVRPLDGSTTLERAMEQMRGRGLAQVVPVGNLNLSRKHLERRVGASSTESLGFRVPKRVTIDGRSRRVRSIFGSLQWRSRIDPTLRLRTPSGDVEALSLDATTTQFSGFDVRAARSQTPGGTRLVTFYIRGTDTGGEPRGLPEGKWAFEIETASGSTRIYGRISDRHSGWRPGVEWSRPRRDHATVSYPATSDAAIGVAAHVGRARSNSDPGDTDHGLRAFSGRGPDLSGNRVVDLAAPDNPFVPAFSRGPDAADTLGGRWFRLFGGTSGAAPHVAGALALLRERQPETPLPDLERRLLDRATSRDLVPPPDSIPGPAWGYGRLAVHRSLYGEPPPDDNNPPVAALEIQLDGDTLIYDASGSRDPDGDRLEYRFDFGHDGTWDGPWNETPRRTRAAASADTGAEVVARVEVRDPAGARSGAVSTVGSDPGDADTPDVADAADPDGRSPPVECGCAKASGRRGFGLSGVAGLLAVLSLLGWRRRGRFR